MQQTTCCKRCKQNLADMHQERVEKLDSTREAHVAHSTWAHMGHCWNQRTQVT